MANKPKQKGVPCLNAKQVQKVSQPPLTPPALYFDLGEAKSTLDKIDGEIADVRHILYDHDCAEFQKLQEEIEQKVQDLRDYTGIVDLGEPVHHLVTDREGLFLRLYATNSLLDRLTVVVVDEEEAA